MKATPLAFSLGLSLLVSCSSKQEENPNTFRSPILGFSITKPDGWIFDSSHHGKELVRILRYQEPYAGVNPSVWIMHRKADQESAVAMLADYLKRLRVKHLELRVLKDVQETELGGRPAAMATIRYDSGFSGRK